MGHQVIKLQNPLKTLGFLQFYRFKTVKDRIITPLLMVVNNQILSHAFVVPPPFQPLVKIKNTIYN